MVKLLPFFAATVFFQPAFVLAVGGATGSPQGFASGTTGGGDAAAVTPTTTAELIGYLGDSSPRVIIIDREFDFTNTEGLCNDCAGCIPASDTCGSEGQLSINANGWCGSDPATTVSYDKAAIEGIYVHSNKSIIGKGSNAIFRGKGLRLVNNVQNVIIQNIHFTDLNPEFIWGGDALTLDGTDNIWVDHCKFSLIGRQMIVLGFGPSGRVTISNCEFDGQTSWSASCDGRHYWAILGYGNNDFVTFVGNYIHHTSGRSPRLDYNSLWHAVNNYWYSNSGHVFDVSSGSNALIEGNVFENVTTTLLPDSTPGQVFVPRKSTTGECAKYLNRNCYSNSVISSGSLSGSVTSFMVNFTGHDIAPAIPPSTVKASVLAYAGVGKI
ncbi:related pectine lyase F [Phialocephala subalpina]|uniref:pectin lyase n=1 Tax=Phialocephala subalpina TaxID=576137 RepID=A0A1L7WVW7_9HELO|nr:related pectine lyase F [Phialocephala subalpina]